MSQTSPSDQRAGFVGELGASRSASPAFMTGQKSPARASSPGALVLRANAEDTGPQVSANVQAQMYEESQTAKAKGMRGRILAAQKSMNRAWVLAARQMSALQEQLSSTGSGCSSYLQRIYYRSVFKVIIQS